MSTITDHEHVWEKVGGFRGYRCAECGEPISAHLSYQRDLAETLARLR